MPLKPGKKNIGANISELHGGSVYSHTKEKFGKKRADAQAIAIALDVAGLSRKNRRKVKYY